MVRSGKGFEALHCSVKAPGDPKFACKVQSLEARINKTREHPAQTVISLSAPLRPNGNEALLDNVKVVTVGKRICHDAKSKGRVRSTF